MMDDKERSFPQYPVFVMCGRDPRRRRIMQVLDPEGYWYYLFIVDEPRCGTDDLVTFNGIFMKVYGYENRKGTMTLAPLFIIKNFEKLKLKPLTMFNKVGWGVVGAVALVAIILVIIVRGQNRASEGISKAAEEKRIERAREWARSKGKESSEGKDASDDHPEDE